MARGDADAEPDSLASRRVARTASKPQETKKEEDVEMLDVKQIKLGIEDRDDADESEV